VRVGRIVIILVCSLLVSGCVNHGKKLHKRHGKKLHKRTACDFPHSHSSPPVEISSAVPLLFILG